MDKLIEIGMDGKRLTGSEIEMLASEYGTGKYVFFPPGFTPFINQIKGAFAQRSIQLSVAYSIKANYHKALLELANNEGLCFDCASIEEIDKAILSGISAENIWLNTPYLHAELLQKCIQERIKVHVDNIEQLLALQKEAERQQTKAGIGIRFNFPEVDVSRFGIEATEENISYLIVSLQQAPNLELKVLHTHYSGADRSAVKFANRAEALFKLYDSYFKNYQGLQLNLGGGISGPMTEQLAAQFVPRPATIEDYSLALQKVWKNYDLTNVSLVVEPGMAIAAHAFYYLAEVIHIKEIQGQSIALINASNIFLKPTGHNRQLSFDIISRNLGKNGKYLLAGMTCMEKDILGEYIGELAVGDLICFNNVGAYTMSYRPDFIFHEPETIILAGELMNEPV